MKIWAPSAGVPDSKRLRLYCVRCTRFLGWVIVPADSTFEPDRPADECSHCEEERRA